jgi:hypothetical protein
MKATAQTSTAFTEARIHADAGGTMLQDVEGTLQRVNYRTGEFKVVGRGQVWCFRLDPDCQFWFDDKPAILRCFHPLDSVRVVFRPADGEHRARALYAREQAA